MWSHLSNRNFILNFDKLSLLKQVFIEIDYVFLLEEQVDQTLFSQKYLIVISGPRGQGNFNLSYSIPDEPSLLHDLEQNNTTCIPTALANANGLNTP